MSYVTEFLSILEVFIMFVFFYQGSGKYVPRAVFVDLEPSVIGNFLILIGSMSLMYFPAIINILITAAELSHAAQLTLRILLFPTIIELLPYRLSTLFYCQFSCIMTNFYVYFSRRGTNWAVPSAFPPRADDQWKGGRGQQLRPRPLHRR